MLGLWTRLLISTVRMQNRARQKVQLEFVKECRQRIITLLAEEGVVQVEAVPVVVQLEVEAVETSRHQEQRQEVTNQVLVAIRALLNIIRKHVSTVPQTITNIQLTTLV